MSNLDVNQINGSDPEAGKARMTVHYDQGNSPAIKASDNVSSVVDNATGDFTVNVTNAFSSANEFQPLGMAGDDERSSSNAWCFLVVNDYVTLPTSSSVRFNTRDVNGNKYDQFRNYVAAHGALA